MISLENPDKAKEKTKTIFNQVIITSDKVDLVMRETKTWTLFMDRSEVSVCVLWVATSISVEIVVFVDFKEGG